MAIIESSFGDISKSVGNITFSKLGDKTVVRKKVPSRKNRNKTVKQIVQQKIFKYCGEFSVLFQPALEKAYPGKNFSFQINSFIRMNKGAVLVDSETLITQIDYSKFSCSDGDLLAPVVQIKTKDEKSVFTVEYFKQTFSPQAYDEDDVYVMFLDPQYDDCDSKVFYLGKRGEPSLQTFVLDSDQIYSMAYVFAVSENGRRRSPSAFVHLELESDYFDLKNYPKEFEVLENGMIIEIPPTVGDLNTLKKKEKEKILKNEDTDV